LFEVEATYSQLKKYFVMIGGTFGKSRSEMKEGRGEEEKMEG